MFSTEYAEAAGEYDMTGATVQQAVKNELLKLRRYHGHPRGLWWAGLGHVRLQSNIAARYSSILTSLLRNISTPFTSFRVGEARQNRPDGAPLASEGPFD